jgi:hypothetical protein
VQWSTGEECSRSPEAEAERGRADEWHLGVGGRLAGYTRFDSNPALEL